jgi:hypothetical protein
MSFNIDAYVDNMSRKVIFQESIKIRISKVVLGVPVTVVVAFILWLFFHTQQKG